MLSITLIDPRQTVLIESGYGLDAIGAMKGVDLPRWVTETDHVYRKRLMDRLWEPLVTELTPAVATGEYLDQWCLNNRAPAEEPKPNHVRDAVRANQ
jgi:hypothetical protein